ncbi:MAG TPA: hypothetical protein VGQ59_19280 [Cyclobacteriaceae bacterium]|jgi:xylan 1,4-beta-xylosidase|nr:hypothetical protein [Cyclobacteriaceae bacterium]
MIRLVIVSGLLLLFQYCFSQGSPVSIKVDAAKPVGDMKPFWSYFSYDEPNYTTRKDGQKLLTEYGCAVKRYSTRF